VWSDFDFIRFSSRHAQYSLEDFKAAANSFERGLKLDPTNAGLKLGLQNAKSRISSSQNEVPTSEMPSGRGTDAGEVGDMADMFSNMGGSGGGMPDLSTFMNNPQLMAMAQQMAANGGMEQLMQNPAVANMVSVICRVANVTCLKLRDLDESRAVW